MNPVDRLLAENGCLKLMTSYCLHLDAREEEAFVSLFAENAVFTKATSPAYEDRGQEAIRQTFRRRPPSLLSRHLMLNHVIDVADQDNAKGYAVGVVVRGTRDRETWPMPLRGVELVMEYRMKFRRIGGAWRIARCDTARLLDVEAEAQ